MRTPQKEQLHQSQSGSSLVGILFKIVGVTALGIAGVMIFANPVRAHDMPGKMKYMSVNALEGEHGGMDDATTAGKLPAR
ncbi:MAG: hypothetical protein JWP38_1349 [Herbaspirillum sp.]|jgi:hypothetical protein|nr:hypothetical protein [Herbaspirillum sp.]